MNKRNRFWIASLLAPSSIAIAGLIISLLSGQGVDGKNIAFILLWLGLSYVGFATVLLPIALFLRARKIMTGSTLFLGGLIAGPMFALLLQTVTSARSFGGNLNFGILIWAAIPSVFIAMTFAVFAGACWSNIGEKDT